MPRSMLMIQRSQVIRATALLEPEGVQQHAETDFFLNLRQAVETRPLKLGQFHG
jgi:hypothetical protein